jgi:hypothetical protein
MTIDTTSSAITNAMALNHSNQYLAVSGVPVIVMPAKRMTSTTNTAVM